MRHMRHPYRDERMPTCLSPDRRSIEESKTFSFQRLLSFAALHQFLVRANTLHALNCMQYNVDGANRHALIQNALTDYRATHNIIALWHTVQINCMLKACDHV